MPSITQILLATYPERFQAATTHSFLKKAGDGSLSPEALVAWLVQDEHYIHAYVKFLGGLLANLKLSSTLALGGKNDDLHHRIWDTIHSASSLVRQEETLYSEVIKEYGLTPYVVPAEPNQRTRQYFDIFQAASTNLVDGLTLFWATEYVYLQAWKHAGKVDAQTTSKPQADGLRKASRAMSDKFIPNWTNKDFEAFVDTLAGLLDELVLDAAGDDPAKWKKLEDKAKATWLKTLDVEATFWPEV